MISLKPCQNFLNAESLKQKVFELSKQHQAALVNTAADMNAHLKEILSVPVEVIGGQTIRSQAGEPPRTESGQLRDNVFTEFKTSANSVQIKAGVRNTPYAQYLEYGSAYIKPRPFLLPTLHKFKNAVKSRLKNMWRLD